jgi:PPK2 family polyphosphate:nucleotide phosphotransferase
MSNKYRVKPDDKVKLSDWDAGEHGSHAKTDPEVEAALTDDLARLAHWQERLYAEARQSLLVVLQGMDTSGKDGTVSHVMRGLNPAGCHIVNFKAPTSEDLAHDFLWRVHKQTPANGCITVFNRSHYEDVLVTRVHNLVSEKKWSKRYKQINHFEAMLTEHGTRIIKVYLHISRDEQKRRLESRLEDKSKQWKLAQADIVDRRLWDDYARAYEDALCRCSTEDAPWYVVPSNHKWYRNLVVARLLADTLESMDPHWPKPEINPAEFVVPA